jgi:zinc D-Ala-D-Ala carboxypeptidase
MCRCGCGMNIDSRLQTVLDNLREDAGIPFVITSGARCASHNAAVGGKPNSAHTRGLAVDIKYATSQQAYTMERTFYLAGIKRIGRNRKKKFFHIDLDETLPQFVSFDY